MGSIGLGSNREHCSESSDLDSLPGSVFALGEKGKKRYI